MLCLAHTVFTGVPLSPSRRIPITCSSLYLLLFISFCSLSPTELHSSTVPSKGVRPEGLHLKAQDVELLYHDWLAGTYYKPRGHEADDMTPLKTTLFICYITDVMML